jgi:hypothetical protein
MRQDIEMIRGDTLSFALKINGLGQDLETVFMSCKKFESYTTYIFQKSLTNGITKESSDATSCTYRVRVAPADTATVDAGSYHYDVQIGVNGDIHTALNGWIKIGMDVTSNG